MGDTVSPPVVEATPWKVSDSCSAELPSISGLEIQEKIGEGGASTVYRAIHVNLHRQVAVKLLGEKTADWLLEPRLMASLAHPNVVPIHDAGEAEGHRFLVMEYVAGGSLRSKIQRGRPWPIAEALPVIEQTSRALTHIHEHGVLHLDLKPENILFAADGTIKVTDFGISIPEERAQTLANGNGLGITLDYAAPERRTGVTLDARYDVFSLATLAYELLTGRLPGRVFVPASQRNSKLPPAIDDVLKRGLSRDREARTPTVAKFLEEFDAAAAPQRDRSPRRRRAIALSAVTLAAAAIAALTLALRLKRDPEVTDPHPLTGVWIIHEPNASRGLFTEADGKTELTKFADLPITALERDDKNAAALGPLRLRSWPVPRPVMVVQSRNALGFVFPLEDSRLGSRILRDWQAIVAAEPSGKNAVKAGDFSGDCLAPGHDGILWRRGTSHSWDEKKFARLESPPDRSGNPALRLAVEGVPEESWPAGVYQPLEKLPPSAKTLVLRFRAKAHRLPTSMSAYVGLPVVVAKGEKRLAAELIRSFARSLPFEKDDPTPDRWQYARRPWVNLTDEWSTYISVIEVPPYETRVIHRNLVIDVAAGGHAWIDDVEVFEWPAGGDR